MDWLNAEIVSIEGIKPWTWDVHSLRSQAYFGKKKLSTHCFGYWIFFCHTFDYFIFWGLAQKLVRRVYECCKPLDIEFNEY